MKVLFVSSGNSKNGISPIVKRQGDSLISNDLKINFFTIKGKGVKGYLSNLKKLRYELCKFKPDIIHAHYSTSALLATLAGAKPLVVSLMGSDVQSSGMAKLLLKIFIRFYWKKTIVKSKDMTNRLGLENISIIPNGVDTEVFRPMSKEECQKRLRWNVAKMHILFVADPSRPEKNYTLADRAYSMLGYDNTELHMLNKVSSDKVPLWINAADVVLLTSLWEGSPNVIKESMACSRPIVATNVGDIEWLFGDLPGHFIAGFTPDDVAEKLRFAIQYSKKNGYTEGRQRIMELKLDSGSVAKKIVRIYDSVINNLSSIS